MVSHCDLNSVASTKHLGGKELKLACNCRLLLPSNLNLPPLPSHFIILFYPFVNNADCILQSHPCFCHSLVAQVGEDKREMMMMMMIIIIIILCNLNYACMRACIHTCIHTHTHTHAHAHTHTHTHTIVIIRRQNNFLYNLGVPFLKFAAYSTTL